LKSGKRRSGAACVELALVVPFFLMVTCGSLEVSRVCSVAELLTNIARDGCRVAVANGQTSSTATARIDTMLSNAQITGATVTISPTPVENSAFGTPITVTVSVPYSRVSWLSMSYVLNGGTILSGTATMSSEQNLPN
jgi:Flp pilus assembly protein TadG